MKTLSNEVPSGAALADALVSALQDCVELGSTNKEKVLWSLHAAFARAGWNHPSQHIADALAAIVVDEQAVQLAILRSIRSKTSS
jgi:hypothetical protein